MVLSVTSRLIAKSGFLFQTLIYILSLSSNIILLNVFHDVRSEINPTKTFFLDKHQEAHYSGHSLLPISG